MRRGPLCRSYRWKENKLSLLQITTPTECPQCNYSLRRLKHGNRCPECGFKGWHRMQILWEEKSRKELEQGRRWAWARGFAPLLCVFFVASIVCALFSFDSMGGTPASRNAAMCGAILFFLVLLYLAAIIVWPPIAASSILWSYECLMTRGWVYRLKDPKIRRFPREDIEYVYFQERSATGTPTGHVVVTPAAVCIKLATRRNPQELAELSFFTNEAAAREFVDVLNSHFRLTLPERLQNHPTVSSES